MAIQNQSPGKLKVNNGSNATNGYNNTTTNGNSHFQNSVNNTDVIGMAMEYELKVNYLTTNNNENGMDLTVNNNVKPAQANINNSDDSITLIE